jgi:uncharacterized protein YegL
MSSSPFSLTLNRLNRCAAGIDGANTPLPTIKWDVAHVLPIKREANDPESLTQTHVIMLLDASGSMEGARLACARKAAAEYLKSLQSDSNARAITVEAYQFDDSIDQLFPAQKISDIDSTSAFQGYRAGGMTRLWDYWAVLIDKMSAAVQKSDCAAKKVIFAIFTDGEDNEGCLSTAELKARITKYQEPLEGEAGPEQICSFLFMTMIKQMAEEAPEVLGVRKDCVSFVQSDEEIIQKTRLLSLATRSSAAGHRASFDPTFLLKDVAVDHAQAAGRKVASAPASAAAGARDAGPSSLRAPSQAPRGLASPSTGAGNNTPPQADLRRYAQSGSLLARLLFSSSDSEESQS